MVNQPSESVTITLCGLNREGRLEPFKMLGEVVPDNAGKATLNALLYLHEP